MKCVMCNRNLMRAALVIGDYCYGPKCARKIKQSSRRQKKRETVVDVYTLPLFGEMNAI